MTEKKQKSKKSFKAVYQKAVKKIRKKYPMVAVIRLNGVIGAAGSFKSGLTLEDLDENITRAFEDSKKIKAVAVQVNSPGGSPVQSELIYNRIRELSEEKKIPVYTFAEDVAASGGYWLACAGDEIYALKSSLIGSIGVISAGFGFVDAIKKLGVERRVYAQGKNKAVLDPFKKEDPNSIEILLSAQKDVHEAFMELVRGRRDGKIKKKDEEHLFSGEFWSGQKALELGLIDGIGDMRSVMRQKFGKDVKYIKIEKPKSWLKRKFGFLGLNIVSSVLDELSARHVWNRFGL